MTPLHAIEAMLAKCTPGEWTEGVDGTIVVKPAPLATQRQIVIAEYCSGNRGDKALILNAPSLLRELVDRLRKAEKLVEAAVKYRGKGLDHRSGCAKIIASSNCDCGMLDLAHSIQALAEYRALTDEHKEKKP